MRDDRSSSGGTPTPRGASTDAAAKRGGQRGSRLARNLWGILALVVFGAAGKYLKERPAPTPEKGAAIQQPMADSAHPSPGSAPLAMFDPTLPIRAVSRATLGRIRASRATKINMGAGTAVFTAP